MKTLAMILAVLGVVVTSFVLLGSDEPLLARHVQAVDVDVRGTGNTREIRTKVTRLRTVDPRGSTKTGQVDSVEVIGLMMMLGSPRGR